MKYALHVRKLAPHVAKKKVAGSCSALLLFQAFQVKLEALLRTINWAEEEKEEERYIVQNSPKTGTPPAWRIAPGTGVRV